MRRSIWRSLKVLCKTLPWFVYFNVHYMVSSKPLSLGMRIRTLSYFPLTSHANIFNPTMYIQRREGDILIIFLYVNDLIIIGSSSSIIESVHITLMEQFEMTYLSLLHFFLGL